MKSSIKYPVLVCTLTLFCVGARAETRVQAELIADVAAAVPGEPFRAGVLFRIPERAHIYWRNPGDSGLPTDVEWTLPDGIEAGPLHWPAPRQFVVDGLEDVNYGYEGETLLYSFINLDSGTDAVTISARAVWLVCLDDGECIPEQVELSLEIPIAENAKASKHVAAFDHYATRVPKPLKDFADRLQCITVKPFFWVNFRPPLQAIPSYDGVDMAFFPEDGPHWRRVLPGPEVGSPKATFHREGPDPPDGGGMRALPKGVLTVPIGDPRNREVAIEYIRFDE